MILGHLVLKNGHLYTYKVLVLIIKLLYVHKTLKFPPVVLILRWILLVYIQDLCLFRLMFPLLKLYIYYFIFVCKCYIKWESPSRVRTEYIQTFPSEVPPSRFTIHEIVKKFETTGSVANKKRNRKHTVLAEETLDEIDASLECTPTKSIPKLAQQVGMSESSAHRGTKLLKLKAYKCTSIQSLKQGDPVSRMLISSIFYKVR